MNEPINYSIFPIGDAALTIDFGPVMDEAINKKVIALFRHLTKHPFPGFVEAVPAYSSLSIYYDIFLIKKMTGQESVYDQVAEQIRNLLQQDVPENEEKKEVIRIPVCYEKEFAPDLENLANEKNLSVDEVIHIHSSSIYRVYMLGFMPGFAYMGKLDERIAMPRKQKPEAVQAGSVGIAGIQTGVYPLDAPGGWHIIGKTPLLFFDHKKEIPVLLEAGNRVQFYPVTKNEFENIKSRYS